MTSQLEKATALKQLHESGQAFVIPNPWDVGSAILLEKQGAKALATTSSGHAKSLGKEDGELSLEEKLDHCRKLCAATTIPVNADFENGFADAPAETATNLLALAETGVAGGSIEDYSRNEIYGFDLAVERIKACADAVATLDFPFQLTARAEGMLRKVGDMDEIIRRLQAFEAAGADVLYAPGLRTADEIARVQSAISKPLNILASFVPQLNMDDYQELGVSRVSIGGSLAYHAARNTEEAARAMLEQGKFDWM